jgi:hypothetical protein
VLTAKSIGGPAFWPVLPALAVSLSIIHLRLWGIHLD